MKPVKQECQCGEDKFELWAEGVILGVMCSYCKTPCLVVDPSKIDNTKFMSVKEFEDLKGKSE